MKHEIINDLESFIIPAKDTATSAVIFVHGYGADGQDLISLGMEWSTQLPNTVFISPHAPHICEANPFGRQWFSLDPFSREAKRERIQGAWKILSDYINAISNHFKIPLEKISLCGFSQGTMMALHTAFQHEKTIAGVLGYSGSLLWPEHLKETNNKDFPVHLIHGIDDEILPIDEWENAMMHLKNNDINVTGYKQPNLGHGIDPKGMRSGVTFIKTLFEN